MNERIPEQDVPRSSAIEVTVPMGPAEVQQQYLWTATLKVIGIDGQPRLSNLILCTMDNSPEMAMATALGALEWRKANAKDIISGEVTSLGVSSMIGWSWKGPGKMGQM